MAEADNHQTIACRVKWFDPKKGFGFLIPDTGGPDILLHANVLRNAGRGSIADGVRLDAIVGQVDGRWQASAVSVIHSDSDHAVSLLAQFSALDPEELRALPYQPARVKWFDHGKGFGFANVFGSSEDVFIHIEVLKAAGLAILDPGEAVLLRVIDEERGRLAVEVAGWDRQKQ
ncbi:MAG: cold-shock protein [Rhodobacterales bacterium]